ncbi:hypothetical protein BT93_L0842 [Corymbia citriodora subsp. variegata]|uniref:Uncharacterized protein n=1 Tax=Corymbia citriodora subsp. variegata TaxID=360336 RepID=A0A8T0CSZ3_CORYI|nr:hypothetical protein BT93_L0842 [Corymbia citriodora subsp. variegata]
MWLGWQSRRRVPKAPQNTYLRFDSLIKSHFKQEQEWEREEDSHFIQEQEVERHFEQEQDQEQAIHSEQEQESHFEQELQQELKPRKRLGRVWSPCLSFNRVLPCVLPCFFPSD